MDDRRSITDDRANERAFDGNIATAEPRYVGLRMTAAEYEKLPDDGFRYELIDGVVVMSPSPDFGHQDIAGEVERQVRNFLDKHPVGRVVRDTDVTLGGELVYRPDLMFLSRERFPTRTRRVRVVPDLVLELLSPRTRGLDLETKRGDYERFGVTEYWIIDPASEEMTFLRLETTSKGRGTARYVETRPKGSKFLSKAIPGFSLDLSAVRRTMRG